jgi:Heparinase II/III-like protein/Heparinase II/III N-terminus
VTRVQKAYLLWKHFGADWLSFRARYSWRLRNGYFERLLPLARWSDYPLKKLVRDDSNSSPERYVDCRRSSSGRFFFGPADRSNYQQLLTRFEDDGGSPLAEADEIAHGRFKYFSHQSVSAGLVPKWNRNPFSGEEVPANQHWSKLSDFGFGDIKVIWELNRFGFVYPLVRAYWRTGDERFAERFWELVEDWMMRNPPNAGPNWKCGQEASFRVMAWCFGLYGFGDSPTTTSERIVLLSRMIAVSGERIEGNLSYALSQHNNHGISEGLGLWTIGCLFPELLHASKWSDLGREVLESQGRDLIYADGSFSQNSLNYQRLILQDYLWSLRLAELNCQPFSAELKEQIRRAGSFLFQLQEEQAGRLPNYGHNDGSMILPLDNCDYQDFRPVIQATQYLTTGTRCYPVGPWDEDLLWLFGPEAGEAPLATPERESLNAAVGGYYTLRSTRGFAFIRCSNSDDRAAHADQLSVDLWWHGQNVACDAGTYSYNAGPPWDNGLAGTLTHNTITVDGEDQMRRGGRFLWLDRVEGMVRFRAQSRLKRLEYWEGRHDGYRHLKVPASHRRAVLRLDEDYWLIWDLLESSGAHEYRLHWLLPAMDHSWDEHAGRLSLGASAGPYYVQLASSSGKVNFSIEIGDSESTRGWRSLYYNGKEPALSLAAVTNARKQVFVTLFSPEVCEVEHDEDMLRIRGYELEAEAKIQTTKEGALLSSVSLKRPYQETLVIG